MILHHIQTSPNQDNALSCAVNYAGQADSFLLSGNGVYALLEDKWQQALQDKRLFLLKSDVQARGLTRQLVEYPCIDHNEFVQQALIHKKVITW
ncbi:sulfurtransferase complex subunit TusB [Shewanella psychropiezotolerans]|uniref:Sulfurtransferase complex subunit TusB n=1 Tax=Shewanella psychropiezotolerans TaxID=2593655 RepID=A0ABX5X0R6_9GAMM|nr:MULTISPECIES: sulfurtransferase complex subunit TusB [Shewanella]MPY24038.1 sulfurtransferase complex subunit TusB [Shewanella sp. YLB-07]QDO84287.1 sulfurtransferase complex subunit TusB [Shewanella psychropiezotolerans]